MRNRVLIFDFDGVIVDSLQIAFSINRQSMPELEYATWQKFSEGNFYKNLHKNLDSDEVQAAFYNEYHAKILDVLPYQGIPQVIKDLHQIYTLAIVSSSSEPCIDGYLSQHGLREYFTDILGVNTHRSKVEKFKIVLNKYQIQPHETLIVTDSIGDIKEAEEVGIKTLAVTWGVHSAEQLSLMNPDFLAHQPEQIPSGVISVLNS